MDFDQNIGYGTFENGNWRDYEKEEKNIDTAKRMPKTKALLKEKLQRDA